MHKYIFLVNFFKIIDKDSDLFDDRPQFQNFPEVATIMNFKSIFSKAFFHLYAFLIWVNK